MSEGVEPYRSRIQCPACFESYDNAAAHDAHRVDRRCRTVAEMAEAGMVMNDRGLWATPRTKEAN